MIISVTTISNHLLNNCTLKTYSESILTFNNDLLISIRCSYILGTSNIVGNKIADRIPAVSGGRYKKQANKLSNFT